MDRAKQAEEVAVAERPKFIRVRKEDIEALPVREEKPDGLQVCLDYWRAWMYADSDRDLGAKTMSLYSKGIRAKLDSDEQEQLWVMKVGAATDAMIESLKRIHIWAIYEANNMATPWKFPNADLVAVYEQARTLLEEKLRKNTCTAVIF